MYKTLLKIRLRYLFHSMFMAGKRSGKKASPVTKILIALLAVYVIGALIMTFGMMFYGICEVFISVGLQSLYFSLAALLSFVFCFIGSVFMCQKEIFDAKDNELLLSMPIKPILILASRLIAIICLNYLYSAFVLIPAYAIYTYFAGFDLVKLIFFIISFFLLPLLATSLSCLFGWIIELITSRIRFKNLFTLLFSIIFIGLYMYIYMNFANLANNLLLQGTSFDKIISTYLPPIANMGGALANNNLLELILFILWCVVPFALTCLILSKTFFKIVMRKKGGLSAVYREKQMKETGALLSLTKKELRRFFTLPAYMLNCGMGCIFHILFTGYIAVKGTELFASIAQAPFYSDEMIPSLVIAAIALIASTNNTTDCSISLEGRCINLLRSMPIKASDVFNSKILTNLIVCMPTAFIAAIIIRVVVPMDIFNTIMLFLIPTVCQIFTAVWGLLMNILLPRFEWVNETIVIKQSMSVLLGLLGGMTITALPVIAYVVSLHSIVSIQVFMLLFLLFFAILSSVIYAVIMTYGKNKFETLSV